MSRLKLELPAVLPFRTEIPIRITDINYGGHLGNDSVLALLHEARVRYLTSLGYSEMNVEGSGIIMSDAQIVFSSEGLYGDVAVVEMGTGDLDGTRCTMYYRMTDRTSGREIARAMTGIVFFDYAKKRPQPVPDAFRMRLQQR